MSTKGQKHVVKCRCILPQFKNRKDPVFHEFVVFSEVVNGEFVESFAQCNNCGIVHRVIDFCKSEIMSSKENMRSLPTISDIEMSLPDDVTSLLKSCNANLATYQEMNHIIQNKIFDKKILLEKEEVEGFVVGKFVSMLPNGRFRVEPFNYQSEIKK